MQSWAVARVMARTFAIRRGFIGAFIHRWAVGRGPDGATAHQCVSLGGIMKPVSPKAENSEVTAAKSVPGRPNTASLLPDTRYILSLRSSLQLLKAINTKSRQWRDRHSRTAPYIGNIFPARLAQCSFTTSTDPAAECVSAWACGNRVHFDAAAHAHHESSSPADRGLLVRGGPERTRSRHAGRLHCAGARRAGTYLQMHQGSPSQQAKELARR